MSKGIVITGNRSGHNLAQPWTEDNIKVSHCYQYFVQYHKKGITRNRIHSKFIERHLNAAHRAHMPWPNLVRLLFIGLSLTSFHDSLMASGWGLTASFSCLMQPYSLKVCIKIKCKYIAITSVSIRSACTHCTSSSTADKRPSPVFLFKQLPNI